MSNTEQKPVGTPNVSTGATQVQAKSPNHDIIVIGASAGGLDVLLTLAKGLPADLPASVFIAMHTRPTTRASSPPS